MTEVEFIKKPDTLTKIKDAIASVGDHKITPVLDAPATPEKILFSINNLRAKL